MSVVDYIAALDKPSCAPTFNGTYLEDLVPGYRTVGVSGRENLESDIDEISLYTVDGTRQKNKRIEAKEISITFALVRETTNDLRKKINEIRGFLFGNDMKDVKLIFNDEDDVFFTGVVSDFSTGPIVGLNDAYGAITFRCFSPFKYSVEEYEVSPDPQAEESNTFIVDYQGTYKAFPSFHVDFFKSDISDDSRGNCGYVAFLNDREKTLQFGNPDEDNVESDRYKKMEAIRWWYDFQVLVNSVFKTVLGDWTLNTGKRWSNQTMAGTLATKKYTETDDYALYPSNYGSDGTDNSKIHGPTFLKVIPKDKNDVDEAVDWNFDYHFRFACGPNATNAKKCRGIQQCLIWNSTNDKIVAGFTLNKNKDGTSGLLRLIVNNKNVRDFTIDMSINNSIAGWGRAANKQKKITALCKAAGMISISKDGGVVEFTIPYRNKDGQKCDQEYKYSFTDNELEDVIVDRVQINFMKQGSYIPVDYNGVYWCRFTSRHVLNSKDQYVVDELLGKATRLNVFTTNDILDVDVSSAEVYKNDVKTPGLGALGNDWEEFYLTPGVNQIHCVHSDWVNTNSHPISFTMKYREVFL